VLLGRDDLDADADVDIATETLADFDNEGSAVGVLEVLNDLSMDLLGLLDKELVIEFERVTEGEGGPAGQTPAAYLKSAVMAFQSV